MEALFFTLMVTFAGANICRHMDNKNLKAECEKLERRNDILFDQHRQYKLVLSYLEQENEQLVEDFKLL